MLFRRKILVIMMILTILLLAACGDNSLEKNLLGDWKVIKDGKVELYWEIQESSMLLRTLTDEDPKSVEYRVTETQDDNFILEIIDPASGATDFLFEGYFENDDTLKSIENSEGSFELIRVDNIREDMAKEKTSVKE